LEFKRLYVKKIMFFPVALLSLVLGCSENTSTTLQDASKNKDTLTSQDAANSISEDKTKQVLDHHWEAFIQNKLDEVMADYTEEAVLITPDATFKGLEQIRKNFEDAYRKFPTNKTVFKLNKRVIDRDVAYILWQAKTPTFNLTYATDTFIIRNGKIIIQTYAGVTDAPAK
jgi:ketosteroid isomerase-like protein